MAASIDSLGRDTTEAAWRHHYYLAMAHVGVEAKQISAYHFEPAAADTAWAEIEGMTRSFAVADDSAADSRT